MNDYETMKAIEELKRDVNELKHIVKGPVNTRLKILEGKQSPQHDLQTFMSYSRSPLGLGFGLGSAVGQPPAPTGGLLYKCRKCGMVYDSIGDSLKEPCE